MSDSKRSIIITKSVKDENGIYATSESVRVDPPSAPPSINLEPNLDAILEHQLLGLARLTKHIVSAITIGDVQKETANQLATCIKITMELKAKEASLLDNMSDEELESLVK